MVKVIAFLLCSIGTGIALSADRLASQEQRPRFRTGVSIVEVDVTVHDRAGKPVRGLQQSDFVVLEDGQPRQLIAFDEVRLPDVTEVSHPWVRTVPRDVVDNQALEGRLLVLVMDDAMLPPDPAMVEASKDIARAAVERMGPGDRMAVVFTRDNRHAQDFTADRTRLLQAIKHTSIGFIFTGRGVDHYWNASLSTLENVAKSLSRVPRRRKAIIYVSIGLPRELKDTGFSGRWRDLSQAALGSNTAIYAFDPSGVGGLTAFVATHPYTPIDGDISLYPRFLDEVSANTGGRATLLTNDFTPGVTRMFEETGSYYLLGYESSVRDDGRFRRLEIRATKLGLTVRSRKGYFAPRPPTAPAAENRKAAGAISGAIPLADLALQATAAPLAVGSSDTANVAIILGVRHPASRGVSTERIELVAGAFDHEGKQRALQQQTARVQLRQGADSAYANYEILTRLRLKPGRYSVRLGAHHRRLDSSGSVFVDLDVPDFSRERLSLSGLLLAASSALVAAPKDEYQAFLPIVPTTLRHFQLNDKVTAFVRIYQGGKHPLQPVTIRVRVREATGQIRSERADTLGIDRFSRGGGAEFLTPLPTAGLLSGTFALEIEASTADSQVTRRTVFHIR